MSINWDDLPEEDSMNTDLMVKLYLEGRLPHDVVVHFIGYRKVYDGQYMLASNFPQRELPKDSEISRVSVNPITLGKQTILAGYDETARMLFIGQEVT